MLRPRIVVAALIVLLIPIAWAIVARQLAPDANTSRTRFDAIVVLGSPTDSDGNPAPEQLARLTEAVREYERGVAPRLIVTGGAVMNRFPEAETMARSARALGVPAEAVLIEPQARNTMENVCFAGRILRQHGWNSAEVVSSASHLPRAGMILGGSGLEWRLHEAPPLAPEPAVYRGAVLGVEVLKTVRYLLWARWAGRCQP